MNQDLYQALIRAARTLGAAVISSLVVALPQATDAFHLDPIYNGAVILFLTSFLNGVGKFFRGATVPAASDKETTGAKSKLPI